MANNLDVAVLPRFTVEKELAEGIPAFLEAAVEPRTVKAIYAYHKNKWRSPSMEEFHQILKDTIR